jgi:hypothetical protein
MKIVINFVIFYSRLTKKVRPPSLKGKIQTEILKSKPGEK